MPVGRPDEKPEFSIWDAPRLPYKGEDADKIRREMQERTASLGSQVMPRGHMDFEGAAVYSDPKVIKPFVPEE